MVSQAPSTTLAPLATADPASCIKQQPTSQPQPLCRYAGKRCYNPRVTKRNGSLHNLCHEHRVRANQNQRRMELKRRLLRCREDRHSRVEINATHFGLYSSLSLDASSPLGMIDSDAHLGWIPLSLAPHHATLPNRQYYQQPPMYQMAQPAQPDYTLSALVGSVLPNGCSYGFADLSADSALAADVLCAQAMYSSPTVELDAHDSTGSASMPLEAQSDMWIVPNFLLSL